MGAVTRRHRQRRRARLAVLACLLWVAGVELLPAIHEAMHDALAPHVHDAGGMMVIVSFGEPTHRHADGTVHSADLALPAPVVPHHDGRRRLGDRAPAHEAGLAHHAVALIASAPPPTRPLPIDLQVTQVVPASPCLLVSATIPEAAARGPPANAS